MSTTTVEIEFHAVIRQKFGAGGWATGRPAVRVSKGKPFCEPDEVAVAIRLQLPASLFKRPQLRADIVVPEGMAPTVITPEIQQNIADVVRDQLGIVLHIAAPSEEGHQT